jgi:HlyD family secretion protein
MFYRILLILLLIGAAGLGTAAWWSRDTAEPARYRTQPVDRADLVQTITANGTLNPVVLVNVGTQVSGTVLRLHVDFNSPVRAGQMLAELDPGLFQAQVHQSEANVLKAKAALALARIKRQRVETLNRKQLAPQEELDIALQQVAGADAELKLAEAQLERDHINLRNSAIRSPIDGVVVARNVDLGQTVAASFQTPTLFQIAQDLRQMRIDTSISEADVGNLDLAAPVSFSVDAYSERRFPGRISQIRLNPTIQQNVVTYNVVVQVDNPDGQLLPGMTAHVTITVAERKNVVRVPSAALSFRPKDEATATGGVSEGRLVYVLDGGRLRAVQVVTGISDNSYTEVIGGDLKPGDAVVVRALGERKETGNFRMRMM